MKKHAKLRRLMKDKGYTQKSLSHEVSITERSMCRKLKGTQPFQWQEVLAICEALDIANPIGWFE